MDATIKTKIARKSKTVLVLLASLGALVVAAPLVPTADAAQLANGGFCIKASSDAGKFTGTRGAPLCKTEAAVPEPEPAPMARIQLLSTCTVAPTGASAIFRWTSVHAVEYRIRITDASGTLLNERILPASATSFAFVSALGAAGSNTISISASNADGVWGPESVADARVGAFSLISTCTVPTPGVLG